MPTYRYTARTQAGQTEHGVLEAPTEDDAVSALQGRDLLITNLQSTTAAIPPRMAAPRTMRRARGGRATTTDLVGLSRSMATMLDAGLPLLKTLETIGPQLQSRQLQDAVLTIVQDIRGGSTLRDAVAKHPKLFTKLWVSLIETGEASGQLSKALEQISQHLERAGAIRRKLVSAMIYPAILLIVSTLAILVFVLKIIPTFGELFQSFGSDVRLPFITQIVLNISFVIRHYGPLWLGIGVVVGFLLWRYIHTEVGRWQLDGLLLRLPVIGPTVQGAAVANFATSLGTMIRAGVPLLHGLEITIASSPNKRVAAVLEQMRAGAREGRPLAEPLLRSDVFPPMAAQMIAVGEETGKLARMLDEIAKYYEEQVATLIERATSMMEPIMLLFMGAIIGTLVVAMYLPIFQLSQAVQG